MAGRGLVVERRAVGDGDHAGIGIDGEAPAGVIGEAVGHAIGAIGVAGGSGDADRGAVDRALRDRIGGGVRVADRADRELAGVVAQVDREALGADRAVGGRVDSRIPIQYLEMQRLESAVGDRRIAVPERIVALERKSKGQLLRQIGAGLAEIGGGELGAAVARLGRRGVVLVRGPAVLVRRHPGDRLAVLRIFLRDLGLLLVLGLGRAYRNVHELQQAQRRQVGRQGLRPSLRSVRGRGHPRQARARHEARERIVRERSVGILRRATADAERHQLPEAERGQIDRQCVDHLPGGDARLRYRQQAHRMCHG